MDTDAAILGGLRAAAHGYDPLSGERLRSGESILQFVRLTPISLGRGWTPRDIALASGVPVHCVAALAEQPNVPAPGCS